MVYTIHVEFVFFLLQTQLVEWLSSQDSTGELISEEAIFEEVLGHRSGHKKGWGPLPKGTSRMSRGAYSSTENEQLKEQLREYQERLSQQEEIIRR